MNFRLFVACCICLKFECTYTAVAALPDIISYGVPIIEHGLHRGCIGGAGCLTHGAKDEAEVDKYGKEAFEKTIPDAIQVLKV